MTIKTLRRKQQKKAKRLRYRICERCGCRMACHLDEDNVPIQICCIPLIGKNTEPCGRIIKRLWTGGGIGRRIPGTF